MTPKLLRSAVLIVFAVIVPLNVTACGGGGGGDDEPTLLMEITHSVSGSAAAGDTDYESILTIVDTGTDFPLGVINDDDDGVILVVDPQHPGFAELVALLTNGQSDQLRITTHISNISNFQFRSDTQLASAGLVGPDLIGATITQVGYRVDAVEITDMGTVEHSLDGALVAFGFPN